MKNFNKKKEVKKEAKEVVKEIVTEKKEEVKLPEVKRDNLIAKVNADDMDGFVQIHDTIERFPRIAKEIKTTPNNNVVEVLLGANWYKVYDQKLHDLVSEFGEHYKVVDKLSTEDK